MMIKTIEADITKTDRNIIVQQVNCKGVMGAGLALQLTWRFKHLKKEYQSYRNRMLEGSLAEKDLLGLVNPVKVGNHKYVVNIFGQVDIRRGQSDNRVFTDTAALMNGIQIVKKVATERGYSVAIPTYIGCGLAGGDWKEIKPLIEAVFEGSDVDVCFYHYRK